MAEMACECDCFSDEMTMPIEKDRKCKIVAFDEVSEINRWISDEVEFSNIGGELANIDRTKTTKRPMCMPGCTFNRWNGRSREVMTGKWSHGAKPRARIFGVQTKSDGAMTRWKVCL